MNIVLYTNLQCDIDLKELALRVTNIVYDPKTFSGLQWKIKKIGGHCMVFHTGKLIVNGKASSIKEA